MNNDYKRSSFKRVTNLLLISAVSASLISPQAQAGDEAKAIIGGILGAIVANGVIEAGKAEEAQKNSQKPIIVQEAQQKPKQPAYDSIAAFERESEIRQNLFNSGHGNIKSWETEFKQKVDGKIDDKELELLRKTAAGQFDKLDDYTNAQKFGFARFEDYRPFKEGRFETIEQFQAAKSGDFKTVETLVDAQKLGISDYYTYRQAKIQRTKNLIADIQAYVAAYDGELDLSNVTPALSDLAPVVHGQWEDTFLTPSNSLATAASELAGFNAFQAERNSERDAALIEETEKLRQEIEDMRMFVGAYLKQNIADQRILAVNNAFAEFPDITESSTPEEVREVHEEMQRTLSTNRLTDIYKREMKNKEFEASKGFLRKFFESTGLIEKSVFEPEATRKSYYGRKAEPTYSLTKGFLAPLDMGVIGWIITTILLGAAATASVALVYFKKFNDKRKWIIFTGTAFICFALTGGIGFFIATVVLFVAFALTHEWSADKQSIEPMKQ